MSDQAVPTDEGKRRYHFSEGFTLDVDPPAACTCKAACQPRCAGECGCSACSLALAMYAAICGWLSTDGSGPTEAQLQQYRDVLGPQAQTGR